MKTAKIKATSNKKILITAVEKHLITSLLCLGIGERKEEKREKKERIKLKHNCSFVNYKTRHRLGRLLGWWLIGSYSD